MAGAGLGAWAARRGGSRIRLVPFAHPVCACTLPLWNGHGCCPGSVGVGGVCVAQVSFCVFICGGGLASWSDPVGTWW